MRRTSSNGSMVGPAVTMQCTSPRYNFWGVNPNNQIQLRWKRLEGLVLCLFFLRKFEVFKSVVEILGRRVAVILRF